LTYFELAILPLYAKMVAQEKKDLMKSKLTEDINKDIFIDIFTAVRENYNHYSATSYSSISSFGYFFPELVKHPQKYLYHNQKFFEVVKSLK